MSVSCRSQVDLRSGRRAPVAERQISLLTGGDTSLQEVLERTGVYTIGALRDLPGELLVAIPNLSREKANWLATELARYTHQKPPAAWEGYYEQLGSDVDQDGD